MIGGYGEHGRNCFLVPYRQGHCYMLDCGIMDQETVTGPEISDSQLDETDYIFITHCHKDHAGAFDSLVARGFTGLLITTRMTYTLLKMNYENVLFLDMTKDHLELGELRIDYGRTGHCAGSVWLSLADGQKTVFYSGDYQEDTLAYRCDAVSGREADIALVDMAHDSCDQGGEELRKELIRRIRLSNEAGKQAILPIQKYGRGIEIIALLQQEGISFAIDSTVKNCCGDMLAEDTWYKKDISLQDIPCMNADDPRCADYSVYLVGDTHLAKAENRRYVEEMLHSGRCSVIITGRIKRGSFNEKLLSTGEASAIPYPHHQSRKDFEVMTARNHFKVILPFHNNKKEIYFG